MSGKPETAPVEICWNVFVGSNVRNFKGESIENDSVIGNGSIVISSIPAGVVAAGNPARVIYHPEILDI